MIAAEPTIRLALLAGAPQQNAKLEASELKTSASPKIQHNVSFDEGWSRICKKLRSELGEAVYNSWFARLELVGVQGAQIQLSVPTPFLKSWLQSHYADKLLKAITAEWSAIASVTIGVRTGAKAFTAAAPAAEPVPLRQILPLALPESEAPAAHHASARAEADDALVGSPLDRRLNFANFLVGRSNQLAHAAAHQVARAPAGAPPVYNPLYIHANVGLGKTHALQALAHLAVASGHRVIYLTAERFMHGFVVALKAQSSMAFKEKLRAIDMLLIDDVQFLQGKVIQQEFGHILNALLDAGKQVVVAADRPPSEIEAVDERVRSRLGGGLCVEMGALDEALRVRILQGRINAIKVHNPQFDVPTSVISYIANTIQTNGRDLEGAINRLLAHVSFNNAPLNVETAEAAIRDLVRTREPKRVRIEDIQKLVAVHFNVSRADLLSARRTAQVVKPRQVAMFLSKVLTLRSLPEIGRRFGGRDHTTVLHAVRKIEKIVTQDQALGEEVELLKRLLLDESGPSSV